VKKGVVWVNRYGENMASYRYRALTPSIEVAKYNGFATAVNNGEADIVVFSKPSREELPMARKAKDDGAKIVVDFSDDHFQRSETYSKFAALADGIVCASPIMRGRIYDYIKRDSVAIPDPYEQPESAPHADGTNYLWFGHIGNFQEVISSMPFLQGRTLRVVSGPPKIPHVIQWTPKNMAEAFAQSNICIFPSKPDSDFKSANRLINAIRAGCFAICTERPAYEEFKQFVWVGNFPTGLKWTEAFRQDLNDLVKAGQDYVRDRYSPAAIGKQWANYLEAL